MSRRKQPNPAKLGDCDTKQKGVNDKCLSDRRVEGMCKVRNSGGVVGEDSEMSEMSEFGEIGNGCSENEENDDEEISIRLNGRISSPSSSNRSSPESSRSFTLGDTTDSDDVCTIEATVTGPYKCDKCKKSFSNSSEFTKHVQIHTDHLQFSCPYCRRSFKHKRSRDRHTKLHTGDKKYRCTYCESAFARSDHLKIHMKTHDNKKPHQCELCNRGYSTAAALASHQQHHIKSETRCESSTSNISAISSPSPGHVRCALCHESFCKLEQLQFHQQSKHNTVQTMSSPSIVSSLSLNSHLDGLIVKNTKEEIDFAKITCRYCDKDFPSMNHMYQHITTEHNNTAYHLSNTNHVNLSPPVQKDRKLGCPTNASNVSTNVHIQLSQTIMSFQQKPTDLSRKRRAEDNEESDKCKIEEYNRSSPPSIGSPYDSNDKPCICSYCYVQTPNFKSFLIHMESHVSLNASNSFINCCPICGEPSRDSIEFSSHIFDHVVTDMTGRCCHQCKKSFDQLEQLQKHHLEVHSQSVYKCTICGDLFETEIAIKVHFNNKHCNECKHYRCNLCSEQYFHDKLTAELHVSMKHGGHHYQYQFYQSHFIEPKPSTNGPTTDLLIRTYKCPFCQKSFRDEYKHRIHLIKEHDARDSKSNAHNSKVDLRGFTSANTSSPSSSLSSSSSQSTITLTTGTTTVSTQLTTAATSATVTAAVNSSSFPYTPLSSTPPPRPLPASLPLPPPPPPSATPVPTTNNKESPSTDSKSVYYSCHVGHREDFADGDIESASRMSIKAHQIISCNVGVVAQGKSNRTSSNGGTNGSSGQNVSLQCAYCNEHCKSRSDLENHMKSHQVSCGGKMKHKCNICDEVFSSAMTLADHKLIHCKIVSGNTCTQCRTVLEDEQCYYAHQMQHNTNGSAFSKTNTQIIVPANCVICCQTLQTDVEVKLHAKFHLRRVFQEFICAICNKISESPHPHPFEKANSTSTSASISICKKCTNTQNISSTEDVGILKISDFLCASPDVDNLRYNRKHCLRRHDSRNSADAHAPDVESLQCRLCRNILPSISKLQVHLIEHNFIGMGQFHCYICSAVFTTADGLQAHIVGHSLTQSPYECADCKVKFFFESELENHKVSHMLMSHAPAIIQNSSPVQINADNKYKTCWYCSGAFLEISFAQHIEHCANAQIAQIKTEMTSPLKTNVYERTDSHLDFETQEYFKRMNFTEASHANP